MSVEPETADEFHERMTAKRLAQGLPPTIEDVDTLRVIAAIIDGARIASEQHDAAADA